jgi:predicted dinucleotide-binding enzyme
MKVGMLGSGNVGQALGIGFAELGNQVRMGSRTPEKETIQAWIKRVGANASAGTFADAAAFGDLAVIATRWEGTENALRLASPQNLAGKVVVDVTNPLDYSTGMPARLAIGHTDSAGEQVQRWLPRSHVVKAFNIVGSQFMVHPQFPGGPPDMFIGGNDDQAKAVVTGILGEFGWSVIDLGDIETARYIEPLAMVWILAGIRLNNWSNAFKLLRQE